MAKDGNRKDNKEVAAQVDVGRYLHLASGLGHDLVVSLLLEHGADPNIDTDGDGMTPLLLAAKEGHVRVVVALLSDARVDVGQRHGAGGRSALDLAAIGGHADVISAIVERQPDVLDSTSDDTGFSALHHAANHDAVHSIDALVKAGANLENRDAEGCTPLRVAAGCASEAALLALLRHGADKESTGVDGLTPLQDAMENDLWGIATALMAAGADVNVRRGSNGYSPLDCAVRSGGMDLTRQVLQRGAIATESASDGCTALHWAGWNMNASAVDLLVGAGADLEAKLADEEVTPLHLAARQAGNAAVIEALARHGADVHAQETPSGQTPLHNAAQNCTTESSWETVDALLKAGADETRLDCQGQTPLDVLEARIAVGDVVGANAAEHTRSMLVNAPKDRAQRAWSRRSFFVMCRAHPNRARLTVVDGTTTSPSAKKLATEATAVGSGWRGTNWDSRADIFQRAMRSLMLLKEDGLFRKIVAFL
ncbi:unnamed protein product [Ectocarpus sp. CCAP 1310/34]|nr:unnamed protein product [Ectocarpus sp. CCAP 1310/34]